MYLVSGISGSKAADMAAVAPVLFPEMRQRGARPGDLVALFWLGTPLFHRLGNLNLLIFFVDMVVATVFAGVPIAFAFGLAPHPVVGAGWPHG